MANIDKVELEKRIDQCLEQEIPLSYMMDSLKLSYPQIRLLINRALSYNRKVENLQNNYPGASYDNVSQDYIAVPHEFREEYPINGDEQIALFKRLRDLQNTIPAVSKDLINVMDQQISQYEEQLRSFDSDKINKCEKIAQELESMQYNGDSIEDVLMRNYLTPQDFTNLNEMFTSYLEVQEKYESLIEKRKEASVELAASKKMKREIEDIREQLVVHNVKLVNFCMRYFFSGIPVDQEEMQLYGLEGLTKAINGFDHTLGYQFSTYAVPTIVHTIEHYFANLYGGYTWDDYCRKESIRYYRDFYRKEAGDDSMRVSARTLAETGLVSLTETQIKNNDDLIDRVAPMSDVQIQIEDKEEYGKRDFPTTYDEYDFVDEYTDSSEIGVDSLEEEFAKRYARDIIPQVLETLTPSQAQVVILKYGLYDGIERTQEEIGKILNLSGSRIGQIAAKALRQLRHPSRTRQLRGLLEMIDESATSKYLTTSETLNTSKRI